MFEKSIAALRTASPDQQPVVAFIGGTIEERNAFGKRGLISFRSVERLNIEADADIRHTIRGRTLAGAVLFGLNPEVADNMRSIQNAVSTAANLLGCSTQDLIHDEYVAQQKKITAPLTGFFRHTDGGLYEVLMSANSSTDVSPVVVYKHWWPFLPSVWTRPLSEWHDRFTPITLEEYGDAVFAMSVEQGREMVTARRQARKAIEKAEALASASGPAPISDAVDEPEPTKSAFMSSPAGAYVEELEGRPVHVGHRLYDVEGVCWRVQGEGANSYAFRLKKLTLIHVTEWHTNQYDGETGVQLLYWDNPMEGLKFDWTPYVVEGMQGFRCTIRESEFKVKLLKVGLWAAVDDIHFARFGTANKAMLAVESHLESKWSK